MVKGVSLGAKVTANKTALISKTKTIDFIALELSESVKLVCSNKICVSAFRITELIKGMNIKLLLLVTLLKVVLY